MDNHRRQKTNSSGDNFTFPAMSPDVETDSELADHLFSNGKFLLHTFPLQPKSLTFSRTCSVDSKDHSLVSSRSTSTNSRSSSCSSARTSTSEGSTAMRTANVRSPVHYSNSYYVPAQRWQFMAPVPVLNRRTSQRRKSEEERLKRSPEKRKCDRGKGCCRRFFRWLVSVCKECHAIEPSKKGF